LVQGEGSVDDVVRGIEWFSRSQWAEVVIVARGGGSLEDLWTFNEEAVARAIAACAAPVVSAVGHETDVTIADFVADLRAPTPSAAAELIVCNRQDLLERIAGGREKLAQAARYRFAMLLRRLEQQGIQRPLGLLHRAIGRHQQRVDDFEFRMREVLRAKPAEAAARRRALEERLRGFDPRPRFAADRRRLEGAVAQAVQVARLRLARRRGRMEELAGRLRQLSPVAILDRGYAIVTTAEGAIVKDASAAPPGSTIHARLARGRIEAEVTRGE
jgi:exodeoxyribonuclease VII large subunit